MKPLKLMTVADVKKHSEMRDRTKFLTGTAQSDHKQAIIQVLKNAYPEFAVETILSAVNGRAATHTYSALDVRGLVLDAEKQLADAGITVANRPGTRVIATSGVPETKSYARSARTAIATKVVLTRTTAAWVLTSVEKVDRYAGPGGGEKIVTEISESAKTDIVKRALNGFNVIIKPAIEAPKPVMAND